MLHTGNIANGYHCWRIFLSTPFDKIKLKLQCFARFGTICTNMKNIHGGLLLSPAILLKVTLLHGCFSRFSICLNGTKSRNASHMHSIFCPTFIWVTAIERKQS